MVRLRFSGYGPGAEETRRPTCGLDPAPNGGRLWPEDAHGEWCPRCEASRILVACLLQSTPG